MILRTSTIPATDDTGTRVRVRFFDGSNECVEVVAWDYSAPVPHLTAAFEVAVKWCDANGFESDFSAEDWNYDCDDVGGVLIINWLTRKQV